MSYRVVFSSRAKKEIKEALKRYQAKDYEVATHFYDQLELVV